MSTLYLIGASRRRLHPSETCRDAAEKANAPIPRRVFPRQRGTGARGRRSSLFREHLTAVSLASGGLNACQTSALRTHRSVKGARMACKPDSVTESPPPMTIPLGAGLPPRSGCQPGSRTKAARAGSLFGIAPGGACRAGPVARPAVGSYPTVSPLPRNNAQGGLFSVALSLGLPRPGVTRHRCLVESGLSSPRKVRPSGPPRRPQLGSRTRPVNRKPAGEVGGTAGVDGVPWP